MFPVQKPDGVSVETVPARLGRLLGQTVTSVASALKDDAPAAALRPAKAAVRQIEPTPRELSFTMTPEIRKFLTYYTAGRGRGTAIRGVYRSEALRADARRIFREEGVPVDLIWLAQVESVWRPTAVSPVGASGIWQFMPATAERFGMKPTGDDFDERMNFEKSTRAAAKYLKWLHKRFDGDWALAIGAYNCGEGGMDRAIAKTGVADFWTIARAGNLPTETANYVPAVLAASIFGSDPTSYALDNRNAVSMSLSDLASPSSEKADAKS
jgi:membrane-bound lytic murein transglycosylase D